jgi:hypothetical protein
MADGCGGNWAGNVLIACFGTALGTVLATWDVEADAALAKAAPAAAGGSAAAALPVEVGAAWATGFLACATGLATAWGFAGTAGLAAGTVLG